MKKLYMILVESDLPLADPHSWVEISFKTKSVFAPIVSAYTEQEAIRLIGKVFEKRSKGESP